MLLLAGDGDWLIPSADEGARLQKLLPRCQLRVHTPVHPPSLPLTEASLLSAVPVERSNATTHMRAAMRR